MATRKVIDVLNEGNPNKLGDAARDVRLGDSLKRGLMLQIVKPDSSGVAKMPDDAKMLPELGSWGASAYATLGTVTGPLAPSGNSTPATGQFGITATGDFVTLAADAITEAELRYFPAEGPLVEQLAYTDSAGKVTNAQMNGDDASVLIEATVLTGASAGTKTVIARGGAPAAAQACVAKDGEIQFNVAAANAQVRLKYIAFPDPSTIARLNKVVSY